MTSDSLTEDTTTAQYLAAPTQLPGFPDYQISTSSVVTLPSGAFASPQVYQVIYRTIDPATGSFSNTNIVYDLPITRAIG
jgi:hypothetical protein